MKPDHRPPSPDAPDAGPPALGVSACLLGAKVRYDGGHKLEPCLADVLGSFVRFVPVCPEVECGLGVPREPMRLEGDPAAPLLVTIKTGIDLTARMEAWARARLEELARQNLCGFVLKSRSPSCGTGGLAVHQADGRPVGTGAGIFARLFMERFPWLPVEDEARLRDPALMENFIERVAAVKRRRGSMAAATVASRP